MTPPATTAGSVRSDGAETVFVWGVASLCAPAALTLAAFANWTIHVRATAPRYERYWFLFVVLIGALAGTASVLRSRLGLGISAGVLLVFPALFASAMHSVLHADLTVGPGVVAFGWACALGVVFTAATLRHVAREPKGTAPPVGVLIAGLGAVLVAFAMYAGYGDFFLAGNRWIDAIQIWFIILPVLAAVLLLAFRSRASAALTLGVAAAYVGFWTAEALFLDDRRIRYFALRGAATAAFGIGTIIAAFIARRGDVDSEHGAPTWIVVGSFAILAASLAVGTVGHNA